MIYLIASILSSTIILLLFRSMQNSVAVTRHTILINYLAAAFAGSVLFNVDWSIGSSTWFWPAAIEGVGFYLVFRMIALTTQRSGIAVSSIATKMSVVIPTLIGVTVLGESINILKVAGLVCGTVAVFLAAGFRFNLGSKTKADSQREITGWFLPLLVFVCTGLIDASFKLFQIRGLTDAHFPGFIVTIFGFAFIAAVVHHLILPDKTINRTSVVFGVALGLANLGTVYFILKALAMPGWESSIVYPLNNFGIVLVSTLAAIVIFGENLTASVKLSLCFAFSSIALLYASSH